MKNYLPVTEIQLVGALLLVVGGGTFLTLAIWGIFIGINLFAAAAIALTIVLSLYVVNAYRALHSRD